MKTLVASSLAAVIVAIAFAACTDDSTKDGEAAAGGANTPPPDDDGSAGAENNTGGKTGMDDPTGGANQSGGNNAEGGVDASGGADGGAANGGEAAGGMDNAGGMANMPGTRAECTGDPVPAIQVTPVVTGLSQPTFVTSAPNAAAPLYVLEKGGTVRRADPADGNTTTLLSLDVLTDSESGLLGMAFHPNFGQDGNNRVWLSYIAPDQVSVLEEYSLEGDTLTLVADSRLVDQQQPRANHNGGMLAFGPDGYLYMSMGDGGLQNDGDGNAQDLSTPLGSILRFNVDDPATPPPGNLSGDGEDSRIFHHGFRNPWRFSFDMATGDLYVGDVGQDDWEEVTVTQPDLPASDFGWPALEGTNPCPGCRTNVPEVSPDMLRPQIEYSHNGGRASVTGGYVYRGSAIPGLVGTYFYADYETDVISTAKYDGTQVCDQNDVSLELDPDGVLDSISSFGQDAAGEVYIANLNNGTIYRIDPE